MNAVLKVALVAAMILNLADTALCDSAQDYLTRGRMKASKSDHRGAIEDFTRAIKLKADYAEAYYLRGISEVSLHKNEDAIQDFNRAIALKPNEESYHRIRASTRFRMGDVTGGIEDYTKIIEIKPTLGAYLTRGLRKQQVGDLDGAIADYTDAIRLKAGTTILERLEAVGGGGGSGAYAAPFIEGVYGVFRGASEALVTLEGQGVAYNLRGDAKKAKGDLTGAAFDYTEAAQHRPGTTEFYTSLIKRGNADSEDVLIEVMNKVPDPKMVAALSNSGNPKLEQAAKVWARNHGIVLPSPTDRAQAERIKANWPQLRKGMSYEAVKELIGPFPKEVESSMAIGGFLGALQNSPVRASQSFDTDLYELKFEGNQLSDWRLK